MKKTTIKKQAIWWAVDPFHDNETFHQHALKVLTPFARALSTIIYPVTYINSYRALMPAGQKFPLLPFESDSSSALKALAEERLAHIVRKVPKDLMGAPIIFSNEPGVVPSLRSEIETISSAALKYSSVFVAMHSHSNVGLKRFYMGSFAETFMLYSDAPMLIFNPTCVVSRKLQRIMFPTDYSKESIDSFNSLLKLFSLLKCRLSLVHVQEWFLSTKLSNPEMQTEQNNLIQKNERALQNLVEKASKHNVRADSVTLKDFHSAASAILKFAQKNQPDLIALAAQSGPLSTMLLGSASRKIVREAHCPVFVHRELGPREKLSKG